MKTRTMIQRRVMRGNLIPKITIRKFLDRKLRDCHVYKKLTEDALRARMRKLAIRPPIFNKLELHQKACFIAGAELERLAIFADTGCGKTIISIALIRYFNKIEKTKRFLVLVPNKPNKTEWGLEIKKHSQMKFMRLVGSSINKWEQLRNIPDDCEAIIETYAGLMRMVCDLKEHKKGGRRLKLNMTSIRRLMKLVDGLVMDESTYVKTRRKLPFRICRQITNKTNVAFALTGTPFGVDPVDLWGQMFLLDRGETLGKTLGLFRAAFYTQKENFWGGVEHTFRKSKRSVLNAMLRNRSIRYKADEADLPALVEIVKEVRLPSDTSVYVQKAKEAIIAAHGNYQEMRNAFVRMRQISSGFLGYHDDEVGARAQIEFKPNPKLELLLGVIASIDPRYKIIVFTQFVFSGSMICRELEKMGIGHGRIYGKTKDAYTVRKRFDQDPKCRVLILQNDMGMGLNLQIAKYGLYYESPVSPIMRKQTRARFERQYSTHDRVFQYDFVVKGTYDQRILDALRDGRDLFESIVDRAA
jgi:SNF2 family DNA or RNA helicase